MRIAFAALALQGLLLAEVTPDGIDCGPRNTGLVLGDGCDGERKQYCTARILPSPPGWDGAKANAANLARLKACLDKVKPTDKRPD